MKHLFRNLLLLTATATLPPTAAADMTLNGAGATFPAPVYRLWTHGYHQEHPDITVNYQALGSGAGVKQLTAGTVDFAGSDNPLSVEELKRNGLQQFPMLSGGVVLIVNLPQLKDHQLRLDGPTLADIYLGKITRWNDPRLQALNPGLKLPNLRITPVRRGDSSGTSFIFTTYLSKVSPEWKKQVGAGPAVNWPVGLPGQKNPGVCNNVARSRGAIGYTEYTYAKEYKLPMAQLRNRAGKFVVAAPEAFSAAGANADWENAPGFQLELTDQPGEASWPITGVTYLLMPEKLDPAKRDALLKYVNWCFTTGSATASRLDYVPLPANVVELVRRSWNQSR